jgi:hypothetical protein
MFTVKFIASDGERGPVEVAAIYSANHVSYEYIDVDGCAVIQLLDEKDSVTNIIKLEDNTESAVYVENANGKTIQSFVPRYSIGTKNTSH